jgi:hypothetical protein
VNIAKSIKPISKEKNFRDDTTPDKRPFLNSDKWDYYYRIYLFFGIFYYIADTFIKMYEMRFPSDYVNMCKVGFLTHHIFTVFSFKSIFLIDHYTWFLTFPTAYHPMMVVFPNFVLNNPIYLLSVFFWMYNLL